MVKRFKVSFKKFIRREKKFESIQKLKEQIQEDINFVKLIMTDFSKTIKLPSTKFSMKANLALRRKIIG